MGKGWGLNTWGTGEGQSLSLFDHITGGNTIHSLIHGQSYEDKYKGIGDQLGNVHGSAQASLQKALAAIQGGYKGANDAVQMGGAVATRALLDREKQSMAQNQQSSISRGLYSSTAFDASQRGITSDTNRSLSELQATLAQMGSNLKIGEGQAVAGAYGNMAQSDQQYAQMLLQLGLNTQYGEQGGMGGLLGGVIGSFSDRRLKTNIELVGLSGNGIPVYEYDFIPETGIDGRWRGVLADEVEHIPGAVYTGKDGYKRVHYEMTGVKMEKV